MPGELYFGIVLFELNFQLEGFAPANRRIQVENRADQKIGATLKKAAK